MSEENKQIIRRYQGAYNKNELEVLDELLDPNWTTNAWPPGLPQTIEAAKESYHGCARRISPRPELSGVRRVAGENGVRPAGGRGR